jgi:CDP-2,3-bis-(O-geranylgeranyl)-sn-glycerol synthase
LAGVSVGTAIAVLQGNIIQGFLFSLGAIIGDLVFAFIKRRLGYLPGMPWPIGDQIGFIIFAILLGSLVEPRPDLLQDLTLLLTTIPVHYISNLFAWGLRWKKNPW